jgi:hypothetical protein
MKKLGLLIFGIAAVAIAAIAAFAVFIVTQPPAKMTIQAIRPTGKFVTLTNGSGEVMTGQLWEFGITNVSRARARWVAEVSAHHLNLRDRDFMPKFYIPTEGRLMPGEGVVTNMIVPAEDKPEWSGSLYWWPEPTSFQKHLYDLGLKTPYLKICVMNLLYRGEARAPCHITEKAPTASSTVTNTP